MAKNSILLEIDDMITGLSHLRQRLKNEGLTENDLLDDISVETQLDVTDITSPSRKRDLVEARVIYAVLRKKQGATHQEIAAEINRQYTSIVHYLKNHRDWKATDPTYTDKYKTLKERLCTK